VWEGNAIDRAYLRGTTDHQAVESGDKIGLEKGLPIKADRIVNVRHETAKRRVTLQLANFEKGIQSFRDCFKGWHKSIFGRTQNIERIRELQL
jgi:hypothetical protein